MFSKLALPLIATLGIKEAQALWGFFGCPYVESQAAVDFDKFKGTWYEVYRDIEHDFYSDEKCTTSVYDKTSTTSPTTFLLTRSSKAKFWGGTDSPITEAGTITFPGTDGTGSEAYDSMFRQGTHQILETDYVSYALMYGCQDLLWGLLGHFDWTTFMSRTKYADARGVKNARTKLTAMEFNWAEHWMKPGIECGIDAAPTADELFLAMIGTQPDFTDYQDAADPTGAATITMKQGLCDSSSRGTTLAMWRSKTYSYCLDQCTNTKGCQSFLLGDGSHIYDGTCELYSEKPASADGNAGWKCYVMTAGNVGTVYAKNFFETKGHFPVGNLTGPLKFGDKSIKTPFQTQVQDSDHQSYFVIAGVEYSATSVWKYDVHILTVGLSTEALAELTKIAAWSVAKTTTKLYWKDYEKYCTGYARIIQHHGTSKDIGAFREGYFAAGVQSKFGRVMDNISKSTMISYTGNWATSSAANGIAVISSSYTVFQGTFNSNSNFPLSGLDSLKTEKTITTLV